MDLTLTGLDTTFHIVDFTVNLVLCSVLAGILAWVYGRWGTSLSNREAFAKNFLVISLTTMVVITIVKTSIALSLGLVGALSIVRFRAAIKEPEELSFLFLAIALGLGFGAGVNMRAPIIIAFFFIMALIIVRGFFAGPRLAAQSMTLSIRSPRPGHLKIADVAEVLKNHCTDVAMKRFDESDTMLDVSFAIRVDSFERLNESRQALRDLDESATITYVDHGGIG